MDAVQIYKYLKDEPGDAFLLEVATQASDYKPMLAVVMAAMDVEEAADTYVQENGPRMEYTREEAALKKALKDLHSWATTNGKRLKAAGLTKGKK